MYIAAGLTVTTALAQPGWGQSPASGDQSVLIRQMMEHITQLEKRVGELEAEKLVRAPQPKPEIAQTPADSMPGMQHPEHVLAGAPDTAVTYPSLRLAGFSDINFAATDRSGSKSGFSEGQFILHMSSALSQKVNFFGELSLTARADGGLGSPAAPGFNVEVERSIIRFEQNDAFKLSFGRYHTPINYWNTAFHHGSWLQTTITRPEMVQFGGSFLPVHFVGALVEGTVPAHGVNLTYTSGVGNGRGSAINRGGDFGDINNNRAWLAGLSSRPDHPYGLAMGGSVYRDKVSPAVGLESLEWIESGYLVWQKENPEFIAEFSNVSHRTIVSPRQFNSQAWYVQTAYRLPFWNSLYKPYYRFEYIHIPFGDTVFRGVSGLAQSTIGLRYDISSFAAIKLEYRNEKRPGIRRYNGVFAQTSFTF